MGIMKKTAYILLSATVLFSSLTCCCLAEAAQIPDQQVEQAYPSCHGADAPTATSDAASEAADCDCMSLQATVEKSNSMTFYLAYSVIEFPQKATFNNLPQLRVVATDSAPPGIVHAVPLYIKNSVLRI